MKIVVIYILFWLYSFLGWLMETTLVSLQSKKFINRGFFMGPYCPIYGTGGVLLLVLSPYKDSPFLVFILSIVICSIIEYLTAQKASADIIDKQVEKYSKVYAELEEAKRTTAVKYTPKPFNELDYYTFNFNNSSIEFYELSDKK